MRAYEDSIAARRLAELLDDMFMIVSSNGTLMDNGRFILRPDVLPEIFNSEVAKVFNELYFVRLVETERGMYQFIVWNPNKFKWEVFMQDTLFSSEPSVKKEQEPPLLPAGHE